MTREAASEATLLTEAPALLVADEMFEATELETLEALLAAFEVALDAAELAEEAADEAELEVPPAAAPAGADWVSQSVVDPC